MTGFVPESPIFSSLQFFRLLVCVPLRRGFPQGARRKNLAGWFFKKNLPWDTVLNFGQRRWKVRVEASAGTGTCDAPCILGRFLDSAFIQARVRLSCSHGLLYIFSIPHLHEQLPRNFSTVPQGRFLLKNHPAKFFLRGPWGKPLLRGTQREVGKIKVTSVRTNERSLIPHYRFNKTKQHTQSCPLFVKKRILVHNDTFKSIELNYCCGRVFCSILRLCILAFAYFFTSKVHCGSAVRFSQALPGFLNTAHHLYASLS